MATILGTSFANFLFSSLDPSDFIDGGADNDTVSYDSPNAANGPVTVNLSIAGPQNTGGSGFDELISIENIIGTAFGDTIVGNAGANVIDGGSGSGNDVLDGAGGIDTVSYASANAGVTVSLALAGPQNTVGAGTDTLLNFENLSGSKFADVLSGNAADNAISGGDGADVLNGSAGNDKLDGGNGFDTVDYSALAGPVRLGAFGSVSKGAAGSDALAGIERIVGSSGRGDTIDLSGAVAPATGTVTNLTTGVVTISGAAPLPLTFQISQFEDVIGSGFDDLITGNGAINSLRGEAGNDQLFGSAGNDRLDGGAGTDTANYNALGATVVLSAFGTLSKGALGTDTLVGIERIVGSALLGDRIDLSGAVAPATGTFTNLATGVVSISGSAAPLPLTFSVSQFENVTGSGFADTITGDAGANTLLGGAGDDTISGGLGNDSLDGGTGLDTASYAGTAAGVSVSLALQGGVQNTVSAGSDLLTGFENLIGSSFNDTLSGDGANNVIDGGAGLGNDVLNGGAGLDTVSYASAGGAVTVSLALAGAQATGGAGSDTLSGFENLSGSRFGDTLFGSATANRIEGGAGADVLTGGGGVDTFAYRAVAESGPALSDRITDFQSALLEKLDLAAIDANTALAGDQAFSWVGAIASPAAAIGQGQLAFFYDAALNRSLVLGNTSSGAGVADFRVQLDGVSSLSAANFVL